MSTLVIHAPRTKAEVEEKRSFETTLTSCIGDGYAITRKEIALITPGCRVVVLDKDAKRRAEGTLVKLEPNGWTESGIERYDVHIAHLRIVPYAPEALTRRGVAVL
jgi:hypothetical protein